MADISAHIERKVALVDAGQSVLDAAKVMSQKFIGSVVVTASSNVKGIFTERDLMRVVAQQQDPAQVQLRDVMRSELVKVGPTETVEHCMQLMKDNKCRHLLVFDNGNLIGIVSLRDLAATMLEEKEKLVEQLTKYITG